MCVFVGVDRYNLLRNNCEHFARWCKTGHKCSMQSESFVRSMLNRLATLTATSTNWLFSTSQGIKALKFGANALVSNVATSDAAKVAAEQALSKEVTPLLAGTAQYAGPAIVVCREIQMVCSDIRDANRQRRNGNISRDEFIKITMKRTVEGCSSVGGVAVALAIPVARNSIGCTLAAVIGHGIGMVVGRSLCRVYDHRSSK